MTLRPYSLLFQHGFARLDPEHAHHLGFSAIRTLQSAHLTGLARRVIAPMSASTTTALHTQALGLTFANPLGLAAGFDKDAVGIDGLAALGFGFIEVGTVTAQPQPGNPTPRLFRLLEDRALLNRMGFNNDGAAVVAQRLAARARTTPRAWPAGSAGVGGHGRPPVVVGVNIGKSKVASADEAVEDYRASAAAVAPWADYLVVNVSSPNTPGLRDLQATESLRPILSAVRAAADKAVAGHLPLLVKIAPDLSDDDVGACADLAIELGLDGIVATNTTISRAGLQTAADQLERMGAGGISGEPVAARSLEVLNLLRHRVGPELTLISVGGITTPEQAWTRIRAGATLVQGYSAFIYEGPTWARHVTSGLAKTATDAGFAHVQDAVGVR